MYVYSSHEGKEKHIWQFLLDMSFCMKKNSRYLTNQINGEMFLCFSNKYLDKISEGNRVLYQLFSAAYRKRLVC